MNQTSQRSQTNSAAPFGSQPSQPTAAFRLALGLFALWFVVLLVLAVIQTRQRLVGG